MPVKVGDTTTGLANSYTRIALFIYFCSILYKERKKAEGDEQIAHFNLQ